MTLAEFDMLSYFFALVKARLELHITIVRVCVFVRLYYGVRHRGVNIRANFNYGNCQRARADEVIRQGARERNGLARGATLAGAAFGGKSTRTYTSKLLQASRRTLDFAIRTKVS